MLQQAVFMHTAPNARQGHHFLSRLCGELCELVAAGAARVHNNGTIDVRLTRPELDMGGIAAVTIQLPLTCGVLGGLSRHRGGRGRSWRFPSTASCQRGSYCSVSVVTTVIRRRAIFICPTRNLAARCFCP